MKKKLPNAAKIRWQKQKVLVDSRIYEKVQASFRIVRGSSDDGLEEDQTFEASVSKIIDWVVWNYQKLDFKSIAAAFWLEPSTVKLSSHFISRDIDLLASCVTWHSLLAFFSAKGLSTGKDVAGALLVDGKLSKVGTKIGEPVLSRCNKRKLLSEDLNSLKKLKLTMGDSFGRQRSQQNTIKMQFH